MPHPTTNVVVTTNKQSNQSEIIAEAVQERGLNTLVEQTVRLIEVTSNAFSSAFLKQIDAVKIVTDADTFNNDSEKANQFDMALKHAVKMQYKDLLSTQNYRLENFIEGMITFIAMTYIQEGYSMKRAMVEVDTKIEGLFGKRKNARFLSLKSLKAEIKRLKEMPDSDFTLLCEEHDIKWSAVVKMFLDFKNQMVVAYEKYFQLASQHVERSKISEEDFDVLRDTIFQKIVADPNTLINDFIVELIWQYAANPDLQEDLLLVILDEVQVTTTSYSSYYGCKTPPNLKDLAECLSQKHPLLETTTAKTDTLTSLLPQRSAISPASLEKTQKLFVEASRFLNLFSACSRSPDYEGEGKNNAIRMTHDLLTKKNTLDELNALYNFAKPYINRHRHLIRDSIFGLKNTHSWQIAMKAIRDKAYDALLKEVDAIENIQEKIQKLQEVSVMPLFAEHRHNYKMTGAFGRTATIKKIDSQIKKYQCELLEGATIPRCWC